MPDQDKWTKWLVKNRYGEDAAVQHATHSYLVRVADRVLRRAHPKPGDTVVDIGTGDGLLAFAAEKFVGPGGHIYFTDISASAVELCKERVSERGMTCRTSFAVQAAESLNAFPDASVDVLVARAVVMYSNAKLDCFREFRRVLKPGGRFSIYEPINRWAVVEEDKGRSLFGIDLSSLGKIADQILSQLRLPPDLEHDVMLNFDERDLVALAREAGFKDLDLEFHCTQSSNVAYPPLEILLKSAPNPLVPPLSEILSSMDTSDRENLISVLTEGLKRTLPAQRRAEAYLAGKNT